MNKNEVLRSKGRREVKKTAVFANKPNSIQCWSWSFNLNEYGNNFKLKTPDYANRCVARKIYLYLHLNHHTLIILYRFIVIFCVACNLCYPIKKGIEGAISYWISRVSLKLHILDSFGFYKRSTPIFPLDKIIKNALFS